MVVVGVVVVLQPSSLKARKCLCVAMKGRAREAEAKPVQGTAWPAMVLTLMEDNEVEGCTQVSATLWTAEREHKGMRPFHIRDIAVRQAYVSPRDGNAYVQPLWVPVDAFLQSTPHFFTVPIDATAAKAVCAERLNDVEKTFSCWRPRVFYHGTKLTEAWAIGNERGIERRGPFMLGYGFCAAPTAWGAARYAHWHKESGSREWMARDSDGAIILVLVFSARLRDMSKNTIDCQSERMKAQLAATSPITRWRAEQSRLRVDHDGHWEKQGYDGAVLPPTCLGTCPLDAKEHWLVRSGEAIFKPDVVMPMYVADMNHKLMPASWDAEGDRGCIV